MASLTDHWSLRRDSAFFSQAQRRHTPYFTCWYLPSDQFYGVVTVGKKTASLAVDRNRLKRKMRAALKAVAPSVGLKAVFVMKKNALDMSTRDLREAIIQTLSNIHDSKKTDARSA